VQKLVGLHELKSLVTEWNREVPEGLANLCQELKIEVLKELNQQFKELYPDWDPPRKWEQKAYSDFRYLHYWKVRERETGWIEVIQEFANAAKKPEYWFDALVGKNPLVSYEAPPGIVGNALRTDKDAFVKKAQSRLPRVLKAAKRFDRLSKAVWEDSVELQFAYVKLFTDYARALREELTESGKRIQGDEHEALHSRKILMLACEGELVTGDYESPSAEVLAKRTGINLSVAKKYQESTSNKEVMPFGWRNRETVVVSGNAARTTGQGASCLPGVRVSMELFEAKRLRMSMLPYAHATVEPESHNLMNLEIPNDKAFAMFRHAGKSHEGVNRFLQGLEARWKKVSQLWDKAQALQDPGNQGKLYTGQPRKALQPPKVEGLFTAGKGGLLPQIPPWYDPCRRLPYQPKSFTLEAPYEGPVDAGHVPRTQIPVLTSSEGNSYLALYPALLEKLGKGSVPYEPDRLSFSVMRSLSLRTLLGGIRTANVWDILDYGQSPQEERTSRNTGAPEELVGPGPSATPRGGTPQAKGEAKFTMAWTMSIGPNPWLVIGGMWQHTCSLHNAQDRLNYSHVCDSLAIYHEDNRAGRTAIGVYRDAFSFLFPSNGLGQIVIRPPGGGGSDIHPMTQAEINTSAAALATAELCMRSNDISDTHRSLCYSRKAPTSSEEVPHIHETYVQFKALSQQPYTAGGFAERVNAKNYLFLLGWWMHCTPIDDEDVDHRRVLFNMNSPEPIHYQTVWSLDKTGTTRLPERPAPHPTTEGKGPKRAGPLRL
jgi:hypothetical protein